MNRVTYLSRRLVGTSEKGVRQARRSSNRRETQSGQALAEAALVLVILVLLLGGLIEFGWAYFRFLALQDAAGEGAAYGIMYPTRHDSTSTAESIDPNNITYRVQHESEATLLDWQTANVTVEAPFTTPGNLITVTVTYEHELITPLLSDFVSDGTITLRAVAVQRIVSPVP